MKSCTSVPKRKNLNHSNGHQQPLVSRSSAIKGRKEMEQQRGLRTFFKIGRNSMLVCWREIPWKSKGVGQNCWRTGFVFYFWRVSVPYSSKFYLSFTCPFSMAGSNRALQLNTQRMSVVLIVAPMENSIGPLYISPQKSDPTYHMPPFINYYKAVKMNWVTSKSMDES